jgi:DNA-binding MarR family transcriptional regulator
VRDLDEYHDLSTTEYQALAEFRYQLRNFLAFSEQAARTVGLEPQQHQLLLMLKGLPTHDKVTIGNLAERLKIRHHSMVELVDRVAEENLVQRRRDKQDQRRVLVTLTSHGNDVLRKLSMLHHMELCLTGPALVGALRAIISDTPVEETGKE